MDGTSRMNSQATSGKTSFEEKDTPYTSTAPSQCGDDIEAHTGDLQRSLTQRAEQEKGEGAPLDISPSHLSVPPQPGIPNGGFTAWLQVACGFCMFFNSWYLPPSSSIPLLVLTQRLKGV